MMTFMMHRVSGMRHQNLSCTSPTDLTLIYRLDIWLAPGAAVVTDGPGCWSALDEAACIHQAIRTGSERQAARMASFKWVNTALGSIKCAITGNYRKLGPDYAGRHPSGTPSATTGAINSRQ